jgi:alpha-mannosidase
MARIDTLYLIHHSHTDIGYTHDQPIVFDMHERFISEALTLAERSADSDRYGAFRWTVENTYVLNRWLQHATTAEIDRFIAMERAGRIEVTGMFANLTPLLDTDELIESLQLLGQLRRDYGFTITSAMNCDVNGENWPLVDLLLDAGIEGFTMAINTHFGGAPLDRPNPFHWQGPSGRTILAYSGWPYDQGWRYGIGRSVEEFAQSWWPRVAARLDAIDYPLPVVMVQSYHPFGDNGSAFAGFEQWIDDWNAAGNGPHIQLATPRQWWAAVKTHADKLPTHRGDWTDFWNFGCASSAREQTINRQSRVRLRTADALAVAGAEIRTPTVREGQRDGRGAGADPWLARSRALYRQEAWENLIFWDEHTWGADIAVSRPDADDTASQWQHKAHYAYQARSLSLLLQRDALAALARQVERRAADDILLVNPLPWDHTFTGEVTNWVLSPRGTADDSTAGRHFQDRAPHVRREQLANVAGIDLLAERTTLPPTVTPAFGYTVVPRRSLRTYTLAGAMSEDATVENDRHRLTFDRETGGVIGWHDKRLAYEWVDAQAGYRLNTFVHEEVADHDHVWPRHRLFQMKWDSEYVERARGWKPGWRARRRLAMKVLAHNVFRLPAGIEVMQVLEAPGIEGALVQSTFLPDYAEWVEFRAHWRMTTTTHPEATYLLYPFDLPGATARLDLGGQAMIPGVDQIPGVCYDYFTVQNWVDFNNGQRGVTIATPDNPMVQLGDFHFGHNQAGFALERALLLGWVTNTYWETNFRAQQPGMVTVRYRVQPYAGAFDEAAAHRFGLDAANDALLLQHLGEPTPATPLPASGALLTLPQPPVLVQHIQPEGDRVVVRLLNASDSPQSATIGAGMVAFAAATRCDLFGQPVQELAVAAGKVTLEVAPRATVVVSLRRE